MNRRSSRPNLPAPTAPEPRVAWVLAIALPLFVVSAQVVTHGWAHPWSHVWVPAAFAVAFEVRHLLHRDPSTTRGEVHWHLYFLGAGGVTAILAAATVLTRTPRGDLDPTGVVAVAVLGCLVAGSELTHVRGRRAERL